LLLRLQVEKIFGPGNQYVTAAKMILQVCSCSSLKKFTIIFFAKTSFLCSVVFVIIILISLQNSEAMVSIDMPAGPSEVLVIADKYANPVHVAADLLSQVFYLLPWSDLHC